jgi:hypothetical protein
MDATETAQTPRSRWGRVFSYTPTTASSILLALVGNRFLATLSNMLPFYCILKYNLSKAPIVREERRIVGESFAPDAVASEVARRHDKAFFRMA